MPTSPLAATPQPRQALSASPGHAAAAGGGTSLGCAAAALAKHPLRRPASDPHRPEPRPVGARALRAQPPAAGTRFPGREAASRAAGRCQPMSARLCARQLPGSVRSANFAPVATVPAAGRTHLRPAAAAAKTASAPAPGRRTSLSPSAVRAREPRWKSGRVSAVGCGAQPGLPMPARAQRALRARCVRARLPGADSEPLSAAACTVSVADLRCLRPGSGLGQGRAQREGQREGRDQGGAGVCVGAGLQVLRGARWGGTRLLREL